MTDNVPNPELSPSEKRALLARLLADRATRKDADGAPLSFAQERLWFFDQLVPGSSAYNLHTGIRLTGPLDAGALEKAIQEIVRRHDALRTAFPSVGGSPVQIVAPEASIGLERVDLTAEPDPEAAASRFGEQDAARPFDLGRGPLIRVTLLELAATDHLLLVAMHHIVSDGWSLGVFVRELAALYDAFVRGEASPLPPLHLQFPAFARSQRQALTGARLQEQLAYWKGRLSGAPSALELGTDHPRPPTQSFRGGTVGALLSKELVEQLRTMARGEGATLFMALLAAFEILLWRRSGQEDFVVGTPVSGRAGSDTEPMIGCFINTLVLRADLSGNPGVRDVLARVREAALGGFEHPDVPFERLVEELQPDRDLARNPLYQVMFNLVTLGHVPTARPDGLALQVVHLTDEPAKLDLSLYAIEEAGGLRLRLVYARDLFDAATAGELLAQYEQLLGQMARDLDARVADIPLVTPSARRVLPDPAQALPERAIEPVTATFAARAQERPDHPALLEGTSTCTYGALSARVDAIAHGLVARGVTPGDAIAITGAPDADLLAGVLGIMRARGVLLLLDPRLPGERRRLMVTEAGARHLLIAGGVPDAPGLAASLGVESWSTVAAWADSAPAGSSPVALAQPHPEDAAYVFFTSGTTGVPKAVVGVHRGLAHFVEWQRETFGVGPADRVAQLTGLSFDVVLREIFLPLTSGASLCLRPHETAEDLGADRVLPWLEQERITTIHTVPTLAQSWLASVPPGVALPDLRRVFFAGEPLSGTLVRRWRSAFPSTASVINLYGPTETTLAKCFHAVPDEVDDGIQPVGRPLPETQALVLTPGLTLCGIGECGEIAIRTPYRTRGYRNAPEEQQKRFVRNPWRDDADDLIYLTGDRGRYRRDGTLEILGRVDDQVKIRGVRIELGEVTATLLQHPAVRQAAAVVRKDEAGHARLVAYVVGDDAPSTGDLRAFLEGRLPEAMVPSAIVQLSALPLTANGKLDRRALPEPVLETMESTRAVLPRTPVEEEIAEIWQELLGRPLRSMHETFFEAGGHSLQATQFVSRLRTVFRVDLPLRVFYEQATVAGVASAVTAALQGGAPPPGRIPRRGARLAAGSPSQRRLWFLEQAEPGTALYIISGALRLRGPVVADALERALDDIVDRHEALRTTFGLVDGELMQRVGEGRPGIVELVDIRHHDAATREAEALRVAVGIAERPFDLASGPLLRVGLVRLGDEEHLLVLAVHHIVSDVWSLGILTSELGTLYDAHVTGRPARLPDLPVQFADVVAWQQERAARGGLDDQVRYWLRQLGGELPVLDLPSDRARPAVTARRGAKLEFEWSPERTRSVKKASRSVEVTPFTVLAAAYALLLSRYSGQIDVLMGFPIAGRAQAEIEPVIGFFVNTLVLRVDLSGNPTGRELLQRVHQAALGAYAHQDVPFDRLVEELRPARQANRNPVFQVGFALHNAPFPMPALAGLAITPMSLPLDRARFDLTVALWESEDRLAGTIEYSTELFERASAARLAAHYGQLVESLAARLDARVQDLVMMDDQERAEVVDRWNETSTAYPRGASLAALFQAQAAARPHSVALEFADATLTFGELHRRSNQLARHLMALGVGPDVLVGLAVDRSAAMVTGMLGIIKAGGAYVPLDPSYPADRLAVMADDARLGVIVGHSAMLEGLDARGVRTLVRLDDDWTAIAREPDDDLLVSTTADSLAYVIYTSGSTGTPKGVAIPHRGVVRLVLDTNYIALGASDRVAQASNSSFDAATFEIWGALLTGAQLVGLPRDVLLSTQEFRDALTSLRITTLFITTALFNTHSRMPGVFRGLTHLLFGGEAVDPDAVRRVLEDGPRRLLHVYGPTECTTFASWHPVEAVADSAATVPIGRGIANTRLYVLDERFDPVPVGVCGELYVGGDGLARGYLNRPGVSAERFVPDPFASNPGARMYRTGDIVKWSADGRIVFVGRADHQVKVRGFRIELGEIESVLVSHPAVREATVLVREDTPGDKRITAYLVGSSSARLAPLEVRAFLKHQLPEYMLPAAVVWLDSWPINANGKIDRQALPAPDPDRPAAGGPLPAGALEQRVAAVWSEVLGLGTVGADENFFDLGGHSLLLVQLQQRLTETLGREVSIVDLFQFPTVGSLVAHLAGDDDTAPRTAEPARGGVSTDGSIAIVAMSGRFPGAADVGAFWANLLGGVESVSHFTHGELVAAGHDPAVVEDPAYVRARGVLPDADCFDAALFGYSPREAELIDPQQRVFLECAWEALESAGYDPDQYRGRIGVFAGTGFNSYLAAVSRAAGALDAFGTVQLAVASDKDFLATRVSYKLNLRGPSIAVQTACSTSLVATHLACQSLRAGDCDIALAGGVRVAFPQVAGYRYQDGSILSPDGRCRAFDAGALGTVSGSGAAIVVLKRLQDAIADCDTIVAVIRGTAINNDGSQKVGFTAPGVEGQSGVIADAHRAAGIDPSTIGYVEAHGTGTALGDPVEIAALTAAFRQKTDQVGFCAIGSLKTNVGHLDAAAGVAGLIKAALAVQHGEVPPSLHFERPNPAIDFASSPFVVATGRRRWTVDGPRRAAVSSFGLGGTNAHVVLEEAPAVPSTAPARDAHVVVLSAASPAALDRASERLAWYLDERPGVTLADVAYTLQVGRRALPYRRAVVCRTAKEAVAALGAGAARAALTGHAPARRGVAFMFSGQGTQHVGMTRHLHAAEPVFREHLDACARLLEPHLGFDLRTVMHPEADASADAARRLESTAITQPALFAVEYALAQLWISWGVHPEAMIGHSIGEYVAACLAGVFPLEDALSLVAARGRLMQAMEAGEMLAVPLAESDVSPLLSDGVSIAAVNAPAQIVLSGTREAVAAVARALEARGVEGRLLRTSHAFHSGMMDPMLGAFAAEVARVRLSPPRLPYVSNVTGTWISADEATSPDYWVRHLRGTVRFAEGLQTLVAEADRVLLEVGPGQSLTALARRAGAGRPLTAVPSLPRPNDAADDAVAVTEALGQLWCAGVAVDWNGLHAGERRRRVPLPTYPFERRRYWLGDGTAATAAGMAADGRQPIDQWLYASGWTQAPRPPARAPLGDTSWVVFEDGTGVGAEVAARARAHGIDVVSVVAGDAFAGLIGDRCSIDPAAPDDYRDLWSALDAAGRLPDRVVHAWGVSDAPDDFEAEQALGLFSLHHLLDARATAPAEHHLDLVVVTRGAHDVTGVERLRPGAVTALAACKVGPHEYAGLACRAIDVDDSAASAARVVDELLSAADDAVVAYRAGRRWTPVYNRVTVPETASSRLRDGGVYLITGGTGGVGIEIASALARDHHASLALVGRRELPDRELWQDWLSSRAPDDEVSRVLRRLVDIERDGGRVLLLRADVTDESACREAVRRTIEEFGALHGVIHAAGADKSAVPMSQLRPRDWAAQFAPRVGALDALDRALAGQRLDFCLAHSSLASVLGVVGHCAYTAAHLYMDAWVAARNRQAPRWTTVDWDNWQTWKSAGGARSATDLVMTAQEGTRVLEMVLRAGDDLPHLVVSTGDLDSRRRRWARAATRSDRLAPASAAHTRPALSSGFVAPGSDRERVLCALWERLLGIAPIGVEDNFFELGGDSVVGIQVVAQAAAAGLRLSARHLFEHPTVAELATVAQAVDGVVRDDRPTDGPAPLTPIQQWFFDQDLRTPQHFNQARLLEARRPLPPSVVERALAAVVAHHEGLRLRFERDGDGWRQVSGSPSGAMTFEAVDLSRESPEASERLMEQSAEQLCRSFDLTAGPLLGARFFDPGGGQRARLLIAAHHLLVDVSSWRILIEDLETACSALAAGQTPQLPRSTTPFTRWARHLAGWAGSSVAADEAAFWERQVSAASSMLPRDMPDGENTEGSRAIVERVIGSEDTDRLLRMRADRGSLAVHALAAALTSSCLEWSGGKTLRIDFEGHGRESVVPEVDLSRTIGWFTSIYPVAVLAAVGTTSRQQLDLLRELLDAVPNGGLGYGALRYLAGGEAAVRLTPDAVTEVSFLYVGRQDTRLPTESLFAPMPSQLAAARDPEARRGYVLEFTAYVFDGQLHLQLAYSRNLHESATIERLAGRVVEILRDLAGYQAPAQPGEKELSATHFPGARLNQQQMDNLVSKLRRPGRTNR